MSKCTVIALVLSPKTFPARGQPSQSLRYIMRDSFAAALLLNLHDLILRQHNVLSTIMLILGYLALINSAILSVTYVRGQDKCLPNLDRWYCRQARERLGMARYNKNTKH